MLVPISWRVLGSGIVWQKAVAMRERDLCSSVFNLGRSSNSGCLGVWPPCPDRRRSLKPSVQSLRPPERWLQRSRPPARRKCRRCRTLNPHRNCPTSTWWTRQRAAGISPTRPARQVRPAILAFGFDQVEVMVVQHRWPAQSSAALQQRAKSEKICS